MTSAIWRSVRLSMIAKNCDGVVPGKAAPAVVLDTADLLARIEEAMEALAIHRALEIIWEGVAEANR